MSGALRTTRLAATAALAAGTVTLLPAQAEPLLRQGSYASMTRVGDLDGDGSDDLVDYRASFDVDPEATGRQTTVTAHRGVDGKVLWQYAVSRGGVTGVRPLRLSSGAGVLLVLDDDMGTLGSGESTLVGGSVLTALDRRGAVAWTSSLTGVYQRAGDGQGATTLVAQPYVAAVGQFARGAAEDVALAVVDEVRSSARTVSRLSVVIVDGANGVSRTALTTTDEAAALRLSALPDLDRDGLADLGVAHLAGGNATLGAHSSSDGRQLWRSPTFEVGDALLTVGAGDTDGDRVADVLVSPSETYIQFQYAASIPGNHTLLDGRTGRLRWTQAADSATPAGDVGRDRRNDVVLLDRGEPTEAVVRAYALDGAGRTLWDVRRSIARTSSERSLPFVDIGIAGDVDADGVLDVVYRIEVESTAGKSRVDAGTISGRTGRRRSRGAAIGRPVASAVDGRGADVVDVRRAGRTLVTTVSRGDNGALLWRTSVQLPGGFGAESLNSVLGARLGRDRCGDVVVSSDDGTTAVTVGLSGSDGRPQWSVSRTSSAPAAVTRPAALSRTDRNPCR
jgi:hypothetical protein